MNPHIIPLVDNEYVSTYLEFHNDITPVLHLDYKTKFNTRLYKWTKGFVEGLAIELGVFGLPFIFVYVEEAQETTIKLAERCGFIKHSKPEEDTILLRLEI